MRRLRILGLLLVMMAAGKTLADNVLVLNELMQSNVDCVMDDLNDFPDSWVELYNGGTATVDLGHYSLGLTADASEAWPLPSRQVGTHAKILVYCDKVNDGLHAPFRLESGGGCSVYLFLDGRLVDKVENLKKQPAPNIAYGRRTDGSDEWGYLLTPTPRDANCGEVCERDHILGDPLFSEAGRVTTDNQPISLVLSVPEGSPAGTEIHYTVDGSEPIVKSPVYHEPLQIESSKVIRAKLFCEGWLSPRSTTQSYIFFPRQLTLPVVSVVTTSSYLNNNRTGIFTNNTSDKRVNWRRPINIEFFMDGENEPSVVNQLCETRVAGAASRGAAKKTLALYAHKRFGTKRFDYEFFPDQRPGSTDFKSLVLRNAGNDFDYLYMRDALVQRVMAEHTDLDWQAWRPAIVYVNAQYYGILNIRERANENNVYTHYDGLEDIDLIENWWDLKEGTMDAYNSFKQFYNDHGHTMAEYEQWMDCYEFINLMVMNLYFNNLDFPGNNIIMWRPRQGTVPPTSGQTNGRWRWIAKDCDYVMGIYGDPVSYNIIEWLHNPDYDKNRNWGANGYDATRLFRRLMEDEDFSREFIDRCAIYMGDFLNEQGIRALWDAMYEQIRYEYPYHRNPINRWWPNYNEELQNARAWVSQRTSIFYQQLADHYGLGDPVPMTIVGGQADDDDGVGLVFNGVRLTQREFDGKFFAGRHFTLEGVDDAAWEVKGWHLQQIKNGSFVVSDVEGEMLSMDMPDCQRLIVTPILRESSAIASLDAPTWTWRRDGDRLTLTGVAEGTSIALYDLRGMLIHRATATGYDEMIVAAGRPCVLKVGEKVIKL